jgi:hypothetical protein
MKYAYQIGVDNKVYLASGENIIFWKELTEEDYNIYHDARHNKDQIIYKDANGNLQIRDKDTIWDEATNSWIPDVKAILDRVNNAAIAQARQAYQAGNLDRHQFSKLSHDQQLELGKYLDELLEIMNIKESRDYKLIYFVQCFSK